MLLTTPINLQNSIYVAVKYDLQWVTMRRAGNPPVEFIQVSEAFKPIRVMGFHLEVKYTVSLVKKVLDWDIVL